MSTDGHDSKLVLLVDDDQCVRRTFVRVALSEGLNVVEASDGIEALDVARARTPDIIVLDLSLPRMDGLQVLRELQADPRTASIPVIVASGHIEDEQRNRVLELGATEYVQKPFDVYWFFDNLATLINGPHCRSGTHVRSNVVEASSYERELSPRSKVAG